MSHLKDFLKNSYKISYDINGLLQVEVTKKRIKGVNNSLETIVDINKYKYNVSSLVEANTLINLIEQGVNVNINEQ